MEENLGRLSQPEDRNRCWSATEMAVRTGTASAAAASFDVASIATARTRQCKNFIGEQEEGTCEKDL